MESTSAISSSANGKSVTDAIAEMKKSAAEQRYFDVEKMKIERAMAMSQAMANTANKASDRMAQK